MPIRLPQMFSDIFLSQLRTAAKSFRRTEFGCAIAMQKQQTSRTTIQINTLHVAITHLPLIFRRVRFCVCTYNWIIIPVTMQRLLSQLCRCLLLSLSCFALVLCCGCCFNCNLHANRVQTHFASFHSLSRDAQTAVVILNA